MVDLSAPEGGSVNDGIAQDLCSLSYIGVEDAAWAILARGRNTLLAKVDIRSAYRNVTIHPDDRWLLGMSWDGSLFVDTVLPFRLRSAPKIFTAVVDAVEGIARRKGVKFVVHYLDDYLIIGAPHSEECGQSLAILLSTFSWLGFPIATDKLEGPVPCLRFELDSRSRVPTEKLSELQVLIGTWQIKKSSTRRELESSVGKLAFASQVVRPGKTFLHRMFKLIAVACQGHYHIRLNLQFHAGAVCSPSINHSFYD